MQLETSTWLDVEALDADIALLPIGSTEQHGPHAPLSTDSLTAEAVAEAGARRYDDEVAITPVLPIGASEEHRGFPGTIWITPDTLRSYTRDVIRSLAANGWQKIVIVNGHGGNTHALQEVAADLTRHEDVFVAAFTWFDAVDPDVEMGHAGAMETAMIRHHHPGLVRDDRLEQAWEGASDRWGRWVSGVNLTYATDEFSDSGVVGDPRNGTTDLGAELTEQAGTALADLMVEVANR